MTLEPVNGIGRPRQGGEIFLRSWSRSNRHYKKDRDLIFDKFSVVSLNHNLLSKWILSLILLGNKKRNSTR